MKKAPKQSVFVSSSEEYRIKTIWHQNNGNLLAIVLVSILLIGCTGLAIRQVYLQYRLKRYAFPEGHVLEDQAPIVSASDADSASPPSLPDNSDRVDLQAE